VQKGGYIVSFPKSEDSTPVGCGTSWKRFLWYSTSI